MSLPDLMGKELLRLRIRTWLFLLLGIAVVLVLCGLFYVRRQLLQYRPQHTYSIRSPEFFGSAHALADPLPIAGNQVTMLENGDEIFPAMLSAIAAAQKAINFEAYIFYSDGTGRQFREALMARAQAGVKVRVILDGLGSSTKLDNEDVELMRHAGCEVAYYHPAISLRLDRMNRRSHRRIMVVDGRVGFLGGVGFADAWSGHADSPEHWRDLQAKVEGPLVAKLQGAFQQHWLKEMEQTLAGADEFPTLPPAGEMKGQMTASHSFSIASVPLTQAVAIASAEQRIWITNPYCTPTEDQIQLLVEAVKRGVDVRIIVPGDHTDQPASRAAGRNTFGDLLRGGVKIYEYEPTMIHQKTLVADSLFSLFGSSNLDARSSQINEEVDLSIYDEPFAKRLEEIFLKDQRNSRLYTLEEFEHRGLWTRIAERLMYPFRSQL